MARRVDDTGAQGLSVREAGARGGQATLRNHGVDFFRRIGRKGGQRTAELYGDLLRDYGRRGGRPKRPALGNVGEGETVYERRPTAVGPRFSSPRQVAKYP